VPKSRPTTNFGAVFPFPLRSAEAELSPARAEPVAVAGFFLRVRFLLRGILFCSKGD